MARPSKFKEEFVDQAQRLCKLGATDVEVADFFGVDVRTLYRWKGEQPGFCQALKAGKDEADNRVERSLFARANGYEHDEVDIRVVNNNIVKTPIRKVYPPDTTAAIFWLKNRKPSEWRETKAVELTGANGGPVQVQKVQRTIVDPAAAT
ncbi:terminase [Variovorax sp.]|uniref:terminase n=1 Tax=Variovorax sp. TaxID=1871043 RepID=UPI003BA8707F